MWTPKIAPEIKTTNIDTKKARKFSKRTGVAHTMAVPANIPQK
jgi:hypothetical protein